MKAEDAPKEFWALLRFREEAASLLIPRSHVKHAFSVVADCDPMGCSPPGSSVHRILQEEYWSGLPFPPPGHLPDPEIKSLSPALARELFTTEPPEKPLAYESSSPKGALCPSGQCETGQ